jgi:hypothetical protein
MRFSKIFSLIALFSPALASAHSFGKLYNLPVPFWMYQWGASLTLIASFLVIGFFFDAKVNKESVGKGITWMSWVASPRIRSILIFGSVGVLLLSIASGLIGVNSSYTNINMNLFWIIFLLGFTYLCAFVGNIFDTINPWKTIVRWIGMSDWEGVISYPARLGYYPALLFYFGLIWFELMGQPTPLTLSVVLLQYTFFNIVGVLLIGSVAWFKYVEFFSVFFRIVGMMSPFSVKDKSILIQAPFSKLFESRAENFSLVLFVIFMLASTAFDGVKEIGSWMRIYWQYLDGAFRPILGSWSFSVFQTIGLILVPIIFLALYFVFVYLAKIFAQSKHSTRDLFLEFAFPLVPIALAYNIAHYFTLIFTEGPHLIRLISDPFGLGKNYFGTGGVYPNIVIDTKIIWHVQVAVILLGHIVGVYLAHMVSLRVFKGRKQVLLSQIPMLLLMVAYTTAGLWILSQPITGDGL